MSSASAPGGASPKDGEAAPAPLAAGRFRVFSFVETLLLLFIVVLAGRHFRPDDPGFLGAHLHPFWLIVVLVATRYGFRETLLSVALVAGLHALMIVRAFEDSYRYSTLTFLADFRDPILYFVVGGWIAEFAEHRAARARHLETELEKTRAEMKRAEERNRANAEALRHLENRIAGQFTSIVDIVTSLREARSLTAPRIRSHLLEGLSVYLSASSCVLYEVMSGRLVACEVLPEGPAPQDSPENDAILMEAWRSRSVVHIRHLVASDPSVSLASSLMAGPLLDAGGEVLAMVSIRAMPFASFTPYNVRVFGVMLGWWGEVLDDRLRADETRRAAVFNEDLGVYNYVYFDRHLAEEFRRASTFSLPLVVALVRLEGWTRAPGSRRDELRRQAAGILSEAVGETGLVMAHDAEDVFSVTCPLSRTEDVEALLAKAAADLARLDIRIDGGSPLSFRSAAVAYRIGMASEGELRREAEAALGAGRG